MNSREVCMSQLSLSTLHSTFSRQSSHHSDATSVLTAAGCILPIDVPRRRLGSSSKVLPATDAEGEQQRLVRHIAALCEKVPLFASPLI